MPIALKVGLTGGIGSGKSLVAKIFKVLGVPCYDSDLRARWVTENTFEVKQKIIERFGHNSYLPTGEYNRKYMAEIVFKKKDSLESLNSIVHPALENDFQEWYDSYADLPYVLKEAALLYETGSFKQLSKMIVVTAPENSRITRVLARDISRNKNQVQEIIKNQWAESDKLKWADFVINNDDKQLVIPQILKIHQTLTTTYTNT